MAINNPTKALLSAFEQAAVEEAKLASRPVTAKISRAVSAASFWYEKLRTAMEYRDEHFLRRSAIQRILTRRLIQTQNSREIGEYVLKELVWARYLPLSYIQDDTVVTLSSILDRYIPLINAAANPVMRNWITAIASSELEKNIAQPFWLRQEALANFVFYFLQRQIDQNDKIDSAIVRVQLYIAIWRAYVHADEELITYQLIRQRYPDWENQIAAVADRLPELKKEIDTDLRSSISEKLQRYVERHTPPFLVIRDILEDYKGQATSIFTDPSQLEKAVTDICQRRYMSTHDRVRRAIVRSIIYIFLTKMIFAFLLEVPLDRYLMGSISYITIAINSLFPPLLMFLLSASIQIPDQSNTVRINSLLAKILYQENFDSSQTKIRLSAQRSRPILSAIFTFLYFAAFIVSFGVIYWVLDRLQFSLISMLVFVFFVSVVSFFAYRIRRTAHQYLFEEKEELLAPISDFFWVPILRVGRIFSHGLEQINLVLFIIDLAIEAPFKVFFDLTEEWQAFIRGKKEEIG